jgi:hypothetical protein
MLALSSPAGTARRIEQRDGDGSRGGFAHSPGLVPPGVPLLRSADTPSGTSFHGELGSRSSTVRQDVPLETRTRGPRLAQAVDADPKAHVKKRFRCLTIHADSILGCVELS